MAGEERRGFVQFRALPDVRDFLNSKREHEAASVNYLCNQALRLAMQRENFVPREYATADEQKRS